MRRPAKKPALTGLLTLNLLIVAAASAQEGRLPYRSPGNPVGEYLDTIDRVEAESSAYSTELADLYLGLGKALFERQSFEEAREALQRGIQVMRVNFGLHSLEQVDHLFAIAEIENRLNGWKAAQKVVQQIEVINERNHASNDASQLPVLEKVYRWYSVHRPLDSPETRYADMQRFNSLAGRMAVLSEQEKGFDHPETVDIYRTIGQIHYQTTRYVMEQGIQVEPGLVLYTGKIPSGNYGDTVSIMDHYKAGTAALTRYADTVKANDDYTPFQRAEAVAQLGDWYLMFEKNKIAHKHFAQAYQILLSDEESRSIAHEYFADPMPVRFLNRKNHSPDTASSGAPHKKLELSIDVTWVGKINNIQVINHPDDLTTPKLRRLVHKINDMRFRPRLVDGEPQDTEGFLWEYALSAADYNLPFKRIIQH